MNYKRIAIELGFMGKIVVRNTYSLSAIRDSVNDLQSIIDKLHDIYDVKTLLQLNTIKDGIKAAGNIIQKSTGELDCAISILYKEIFD